MGEQRPARPPSILSTGSRPTVVAQRQRLMAGHRHHMVLHPPTGDRLHRSTAVNTGQTMGRHRRMEAPHPTEDLLWDPTVGLHKVGPLVDLPQSITSS